MKTNCDNCPGWLTIKNNFLDELSCGSAGKTERYNLSKKQVIFAPSAVKKIGNQLVAFFCFN